MITVTQSQDKKELLIKSHFYYSDRLRQLPHAKWNPEIKAWSIPEHFKHVLDNAFCDEIYYKTPRWVIFNEPMPDLSNIYEIDNSIIVPDLKHKLYDYQHFGAKFAIDRLNTEKLCIIADDVGLGKCHGKGQEILMFNGDIKKVEDIQVGENLMGDDGTPRTVLTLARGREQMYNITLRNKDSFTCNESHILALHVSKGSRYKQWKSEDKVEMTVKDYLELPDWVKRTVFKMYKVPIENFNHPEQPRIDPYMYGVWLGDGSSEGFSFTINDKDLEVINHIKDYSVLNDLHIRKVKLQGCHEYHLNKGPRNSYSYLERTLTQESALNGKHILPEYKYGSNEVRLQVLAGLLDTDGCLFDNCYEIVTKFIQLREDILFICRSLGLSVSHNIKTVKGVDYYRVHISGHTDIIPCKLSRKIASPRKQKKDPLVYNFKVEALGVDDYYGFELTGNKLYCLGDFTVTHNTPTSLSVLLHSVLHNNTKKVLLICKKSIKPQWEEEIDKFTDLRDDFVIERTGDTKAKRIKSYKNVATANKAILITNYHVFLNDEKEVADLGFDFVLIDEVHCVSSPTTKMNKAIGRVVKGLPSLFLTGTPIMSKPEQVYGIVSLSSNSYFPPFKEFKKQFIVEQFQNTYMETVGAKNLSILRDLVQNIMIRRTEYEVSVQLPDIIETVINCDADNTQKKIMKEISQKREELLNSFQEKMDIYNKNKNPKIYEELRQLDASIKGLIAATQAVADDPKMFERSNSKYLKKQFLHLLPNSYVMSSKIEKTLDIVSNIVDSGHKVIIFTKFKTSAILLKEHILSKLKLNALIYSGDENEQERINNLSLFKTDDDYNVLIGTEAMSEGLNIVVAKYVINFNLPDTAAIYVQRIGRVRRVSSTFNNVVVYNMITEGSKDEERWENIEKNKDLQGALINVNEAQRKSLIEQMKLNS